MELNREPEEVLEAIEPETEEDNRGNRISTTARGCSSYRGTKYRARRSIRSNEPEPEEDTEAIELVPQPEDVPAIVELNTEPEEVSKQSNQ